MWLRSRNWWLILAFATCFLQPSYAARDLADEAERKAGQRNMYTLKIDDHQYRSIGPGAGAPGILGALAGKLDLFRSWLKEEIVNAIRRNDEAHLDEAQDFVDSRFSEDRRGFTNQFFIILLIALKIDSEPSAATQAKQLQLEIPNGVLYRSQDGIEYSLDLSSFEAMKASVDTLLGLLDVARPRETLLLLDYLAKEVEKPAYYHRHERLVRKRLDSWDSLNRRERQDSRPEARQEVRQVILELLFLRYLVLRVEGDRFPELPTRTGAESGHPDFRTFLPPLSTISGTGRVLNSKSSVIFSPEVTYSNSPGAFDLGFRTYVPSKYGIALFGNLDLSPSSRELVHSLGSSRQWIERYHHPKKPDCCAPGELERLRDRVLFSIYGVEKQRRAGVADSFDRSAEALKILIGATYHTFEGEGSLRQGGFALSRLLRLRPLDDDSAGLRVAGGLQAVGLRFRNGSWSELRPSIGLVFQDKVQNLQLPENPFSLISAEGDQQLATQEVNLQFFDPEIRRKTNRQLGLIRWNYQLGFEYFPDSALSQSDSYQLFLRYRLQPKKPPNSLEEWERRITDLTFSIGKGGDRGMFFGITLTKGMRL